MAKSGLLPTNSYVTQNINFLYTAVLQGLRGGRGSMNCPEQMKGVAYKSFDYTAALEMCKTKTLTCTY